MSNASTTLSPMASATRPRLSGLACWLFNRRILIVKTIVINATLTTVGPLSIPMPIAEGQLGNKFNNFPIVTRGMDEDGNKQQTGYLPATTLRGFLRRAIVIDQMTHAAAEGHHYTLQRAYADLIGQ